MFLTCRKISRWRTRDMNFPIQSNPQAAFLCDMDCRLFVTVVQFEAFHEIYGTTVKVFL